MLGHCDAEAKPKTAPAFVNKTSLEHSPILFFLIASGCCTAVVGLSAWADCVMTGASSICCLAPYRMFADHWTRYLKRGFLTS